MSGFVIKVILASKDKLGIILPLPIFWKNMRSVSINSSLNVCYNLPLKPSSLGFFFGLFSFQCFLFFSFLFTDSICLLSISTLSHPHKSQKKKKNLNKLEIKYFSQIQQRTEVTGHTTAPRIGETDRVMTWEQELRAETPRDLAPGQETSAILTKCSELVVQSQQTPHSCEFHLEKP